MDNKNTETRPDMEQQEEQMQDKDSGTHGSEGHKGKKSKGSKKIKAALEEEYKAKIDELNDKFLRLYSEFDNYRRRTSKEKLDLAKTASEEVITDLLPVLDDFERAIKSSESASDSDAIKEGMQLIYNKIKGTLTKKGLSAIEATGQEFDTDYHEAITYIPAPSDDLKGKVVDEVEKGYMLNDKVIRYTKVVIGQ